MFARTVLGVALGTGHQISTFDYEFQRSEC